MKVNIKATNLKLTPKENFALHFYLVNRRGNLRIIF